MITNFQRDPLTDSNTQGRIYFSWTYPTAPVSAYREYRDGYPSTNPTAQDGVLQASELTYEGATTSPDWFGGGLPCSTNWKVGLQAVGTDGTAGPRVEQVMATRAC